MLSQSLFYAMLALFLTHELDAVKRHEWRILPLTSFLSERIGALVFIWAHAPLLFVIFWYAGLAPNGRVALMLSGFAVAHVGLHWLFRRHPANEFSNPGSWLLIVATGVFGGLHLLSTLL